MVGKANVSVSDVYGDITVMAGEKEQMTEKRKKS